MKKILDSRRFCFISAFCVFLIICAAGLSAKAAEASPLKYDSFFKINFICFIIGFVLCAAAFFFPNDKKLSEKTVFGLSLFSAALIVLTFWLNFGIMSLGLKATAASRWIRIGDFALDTAAFLPFLIFLTVIIIMKKGGKYLWLSCLLCVVPASLVLIEPNFSPAFVFLVSVFLLMLKMNRDGKIKIGIIMICLGVVFCAAVCVVILKSDYFLAHIAKLFPKDNYIIKYFPVTEATNVRMKLFGPASMSTTLNGDPVKMYMIPHRRMELLCIAYRFGIIPLILICLLYAILLGVLYINIETIENQTEKYISYGIFYYFAVKFIYGIISQFVLCTALCSTPFIGGETSVCIDMMLFGIILNCIRRNGNGRKTVQTCV